MRLVRQPEGSHCCGQACVATIAGVSLSKACKVVGHAGGTAPKEVASALKQLGLRVVGKRLRRLRRDQSNRPMLGVFKVVDGRPHWHWVVVFNGEIYDPAEMLPHPKLYNLRSFLEVKVA